ncbi:MAG: hypothetical protein MUF54_03990, partial [Polyangiaceae bacterium]|nr:hypothetical protein [Polyangiaceae bacterium]
AFLSLYTTSQALTDLLSSLQIEIVHSKMGTRELVLSFAAESSGRMDRIAEVARVALGHTFTGTSRHFVQYRDASAPFGFDVPQVLAADGDYLLYHNSFNQVYWRERDLDLAGLLLRLRPHPDPSFGRDPGPAWLVSEEGLGPAVIHYFIRSRVDAQVGLAEWPPPSALDPGPVRRYLFYVEALPDRMSSLVRKTPGISLFKAVAPGAAVQVGYRHPVTLRACPIFPADGLVLFRAEDQEPLRVERLPAMGAVGAFARVTFHNHASVAFAGNPGGSVPNVTVPVRLLPSIEPWHAVRATFVHPSEFPVLRRILYALGPRTLRDATIAFTHLGAFLLNPAGVETTPVGQFFEQLRAGLFIAAGYDAVPAVDPEVLHHALGSPSDHHIFLLPDKQAIGVPINAFVPLRTAIVEGHAWAPLNASPLENALATEIPEVVLGEASSPPALPG